MNKIQLRPHHAVCFNLFKGLGYSNEFTQNMNRIVNLPNDTNIEITFGLDSVCSNCPNNLINKCSSEIKVNSYDKMVADLCNFHNHEIITLGEFKQLGLNKILRTDNFDKICKSCEYYEFCKKIKEEDINQ